MQKEGHIYCNTIEYFRTIEDNDLKGDRNEGKDYLMQSNNISISREGKTLGRKGVGQIFFERTEDKGNIFCLYGVETKLVDLINRTLQRIIIEKSAQRFGDSALLILDIKAFKDRIEKKLINLSREFQWSPVNYFDPKTYDGELSPFYKSQSFRYQNEVRLWIPNNSGKPFEFSIGNISDISHKIPVTDLDKIEVEVK